MSLGGGYNEALDTAVKNAANQGIKFALAAGNDGSDVDGYSPAAAGDHENVWTVSANDNRYQMASFSNWDNTEDVDDCDVSAPGVDVLSWVGNGYDKGTLQRYNGTSMACPHVAGLLLVGQNGVPHKGPDVTPNGGGYADPFAMQSEGEYRTIDLSGDIGLYERNEDGVYVVRDDSGYSTIKKQDGTEIIHGTLAHGAITAEVVDGVNQWVWESFNENNYYLYAWRGGTEAGDWQHNGTGYFIYKDGQFLNKNQDEDQEN